MLTSAHIQEVSSRNEGGRTKTHVGRSFSCCNEELARKWSWWC